MPHIKLLLPLFALALPGCVTTNSGPVAFYDVSKLEVPTPGESHIYFMRPGHLIGALMSAKITMNGRTVGSLSNGSYFVVKTPPGQYQVSLEWGLFSGRQTLEVTARPGERTYVEAECQTTRYTGTVTYYNCLAAVVPEIRALRIFPDLSVLKSDL